LAFITFFCVTYLLATELISEKKSKGEVLIFRRGKLADAKIVKVDEETGPSSPANFHKQASKPSKNSEPQTAIFHWEDVCYDIKIENETRRILDNVDGYTKPGTLTALMVYLYMSCFFSQYTKGFCRVFLVLARQRFWTS